MSSHQLGSIDEQRPKAIAYEGWQYAYGTSISDDSSAFQSYVLLALRHKYLILAFTVLAGAIAATVSTLAPKVYTASAAVNVGSYLPPVDGPMAAFLKEETNKKTYLRTQLELLKSHKIARAVLQKDSAIYAYFAGPLVSPVRPKDKNGDALLPPIGVSLMDSYLSELRHALVSRTSVVRISASASNPEMAARIANAHAAAFSDLVKGQRIEAANVNLDFLENRLKSSKAQVEKAEAELAEFVANNTIDLSSEGTANIAGSQLTSLVTQLSKATMETASMEEQIRSAYSSNDRTRYNFNAQSRDKYVEFLGMKKDYRNLTKRIPSRNHPWVADLRQKIDLTKKGLDLSKAQFLQQMQAELKGLRSRESSLKEQFESLQSEEKGRSKAKVQYLLLKTKLQTAENAFREINSRYEDAAVNAESQQNTVRILDQAVAPSFPSGPNRTFNTVLGLALGFLTALTLILLIEAFDNSVSSMEQLELLAGLPVLGLIPKFSNTALNAHSDEHHSPRDMEGSSEQVDPLLSCEGEENNSHDYAPSLVTARSPHSVESEAFRAIRSSITRSSLENELHTILVASAQKSDGKTLLSTNLAVSLAHSNEKTVIIDADLRLPKVSTALGVSADLPGLSDYLNGSIELKDAIHSTGIENLWVIPAGAGIDFPSEKLRSNRMKNLLDKMRDHVDRIVVDSPPAAGVSDSLVLSELVDGVVLIVRSRKTPAPLVKTVISRFRLIGVPVVGTVLNDIKASHNYRQSEYYYAKGYTK